MTELTFADRLGELTGVQRHADGFLAATVKAARTGIQLYTGDELGIPDMDVVRVYRPEDEVLKITSMATFKGKAVTDGHPKERVTSKNDKALRGGTVMGVARDGETVATDIIISDAALIAKVEKGDARQLSAGYTARLDPTPGVTADGQEYDAIQRDIYVDHLAIVPEARGGKELRIGDGVQDGVIYPIPNRAKKEDRMSDAPNKTVTVDGRSVLTDAAGEVILDGLLKSMATVKDENETLTTTIADQKKTIETKDGEIAALKKQLEDGKMTPAKLSELVVARDATMKKAKAMGVSEDDMKDMDEGEMKKAAVTRKMGDSAKDWTDDMIAGAFASLDAKPEAPKVPGKTKLGDGVSTPTKTGFSDAALKAAGVKLKKEEA